MSIRMIFRFTSFLTLILMFGVVVQSQTTEFTYQGSLNDGSQPANGAYDFEFALFDALSGGTQINSIPKSNVAVTDGVFTVKLNFFDEFPGAGRWLEIRVMQSNPLSGDKTGLGQTGFTVLSPRQAVTSIPYSIKSLNAENAINASQLEGISVAGFIQNTATQQPASNFNISGTGQANVLDVTTQFNIGGDRVLSIPGSGAAHNLAVGVGAGASITFGNLNSFFGSDSGTANTSGSFNSFFGRNAGKSNTTGSANAFFGNDSGILNTTGGFNSFFGLKAGLGNSTGDNNSFFGATAGQSTTAGSDNSFFGRDAGVLNTNGSSNSFFGRNAGDANTSGTGNTFLGRVSGGTNTTGSQNTGIGYGADVSSGDLSFATAVGSDAVVTANNTIQLGRDGFDKVVIGRLGGAGSTALCQNASKEIAGCSSSIRYKSNIENFSFGLDLIRKLRPVSFNWKEGGMLDVGLVAEEVAEVEPLLTTTVDGRVEGVKYDRIGVVLVNAVLEQQEQINSLNEKEKTQNERAEKQAQEIGRLQNEVKALKAIVCELKPEAAVCREKQ